MLGMIFLTQKTDEGSRRVGWERARTNDENIIII